MDDERIAGLAVTTRDVAAHVRGFEVPLDTAGAFPNARKPHVACVGPAAAVPAFGALCDAVRRPLAAYESFTERTGARYVALDRFALSA